jgi:hypothetical protein
MPGGNLKICRRNCCESTSLVAGSGSSEGVTEAAGLNAKRSLGEQSETRVSYSSIHSGFSHITPLLYRFMIPAYLSEPPTTQEAQPHETNLH